MGKWKIVKENGKFSKEWIKETKEEFLSNLNKKLEKEYKELYKNIPIPRKTIGERLKEQNAGTFKEEQTNYWRDIRKRRNCEKNVKKTIDKKKVYLIQEYDKVYEILEKQRVFFSRIKNDTLRRAPKKDATNWKKPKNWYSIDSLEETIIHYKKHKDVAGAMILGLETEVDAFKKLTTLGHSVFGTYEFAPSDLIVDETYFLDCKGTKSTYKTGYNTNNYNITISKSELVENDFILVKIVDPETWYVIPTTYLTSLYISIPDTIENTNKYKYFKNRWDLLKLPKNELPRIIEEAIVYSLRNREESAEKTKKARGKRAYQKTKEKAHTTMPTTE